MIRIKTKFYLEDLPGKKVYILIEEKFRKAFLEKFLSYFCKKKKEARIKAGKWLGVKYSAIREWEYGPRRNRKNFMPLWACLKISEFLVAKENKIFSIREIEKRIVCYRKKSQNNTVTNPRFPIDFETEEGAIVSSALLCDGGITRAGTPLYNNSELCMRQRVVGAFNKLFGKIKTNAYAPYSNNAIIFPQVLTDILVHTLNMQIGDKVTNNPKIPKLVFLSNNEKVIGAFLNQAFSDDGTAYTIKCNGQGAVAFGLTVDVTKFSSEFRERIKKERLTRYAPEVVKGCKILLEKLGIKVNGPYFKYEYKREGGIVHSWSIQIQGKRNLEKFRNKVGFSIPRKNNKVDEIINNYKGVEYRESFEDAWKKVIDINQENQVINTKTFMKKRQCTLENARYLLKLLRKGGVIIRVGGGHKKGIHSCTPFEYKLLKSFKENHQNNEAVCSN
jgi:hypothetical protein